VQFVVVHYKSICKSCLKAPVACQSVQKFIAEYLQVTLDSSLCLKSVLLVP
jgi:hypothetical protein